jgi:hypothetical protein
MSDKLQFVACLPYVLGAFGNLWPLLPSLWEGLGEGLARAKTKLISLRVGWKARAEASFRLHKQLTPPLTPPRRRGIY